MKAIDVEVARLFEKAELRGACLVPACKRVRENLVYRIERGDVVRPVRGMYVQRPYWEALSKCQRQLHFMRTMQDLHPEWIFCHESAAVAFGLPVSYKRLDVVHVVSNRANRNANSKSVRWHVVEDCEPVIVCGLRVTSLSRTVFDCMRMVDFKQALAVADGAVRISGSPSSSFVTRFERIGGSHVGATRAIRTMHYADASSESGGESIARATMIQHGFALPELQVSFPQPLNEKRSYRVDFLWTRLDGSKVVGEFDGMQKYEDATMLNGRSRLRALADERHREAELSLYGMPIVRFSYQDVVNEIFFASLLERYGIPRSDEIARAQRRLERSRSREAQLFAVCTLSD